MRLPAHIARALAQLPDSRVLTRHQAFIQALPCAACGKPAPSECAQVWRGTEGGIGGAAGERYLAPLCGPETVWQDCCHSQRYFLGQTRFWSELGIDPLDLAARLWRVSGDAIAGALEVRRARQRIAGSGGSPMSKRGEAALPRCAEPSGWRISSQMRPPAAAQDHGVGEAALLLEGGA